MIAKFYYLKYSLVIILMFVGIKMLISEIYHIPTLISLSVVGGILTAGILASVYHSKNLDSTISK